MQRILVTGAEGFIGRPLMASLDGRAEALTARGILGRRADLLDVADRANLIDAARADTLIHLAWVTAHGKYWNAPENADWEAASADLFHRFYASGGRRIVGIGTCAEYDWTTGAARFAEGDPLAPHTRYGAAKRRTAEKLARLADEHSAAWAWGRVFFSFGPGEPPGRLVPLMIRSALSGQPLDCGPGDTVRDFWHVRDLGNAVGALALSDAVGPVNLGCGEAVSFDALARLVEEITGTRDMIRTGQRELGPGEPKAIVANVSRLSSEVGFQPAVSLEVGIKDYVETIRLT